MGASNVAAAFRLYAGRVPPLSMQLLTYMALVSRDDDDRPWYGQGHEALALFALGRPAPATRADIAAVERGISPLLTIGAIEADRRASVRRNGPSTVRYRLRIVAAEPASIDEPPVDNPVRDHNGHSARPTDSVTHVPRNPCSRPTESVTTPHGNRGTEEPRGTRRSEEEENQLDHQSKSPPQPAEPANTEEETPIDDSVCPGCGVILDPDRVCRHRPCDHYGTRIATVHPLVA